METRFHRPHRGKRRILPADWQARLPLRPLLYGFITVVAVAILFAVFLPRGSAFESEEMSDLRTRGVLRVGVESNLPGLHADGKGLTVDIARLFAQEIFGEDAALELVPMTRQNVRTALADGDVDLALLSISGINADAYAKGRPYYAENCYLYAYTGSLPAEPIIAVLQNSDAETVLITYEENTAPDIIIISGGGYEDMRILLAAGRADALCLPALLMQRFRDPELRAVGESVGTISYRPVALKENDWLLDALDELIIRWTQDGTLAALYGTHGL